MQRRSIQFSVLESICRVLDVQPGDIYSYAPTSIDPELPDVAKREISRETVGEKPAKTEETSDPKQQPNDWRAW
jgi:hypothetical protein